MLAVTPEPQYCGHQDRPGYYFASSIYKKNQTGSLWHTGENYTPSAVLSPPLKVASRLQTATRSRSRASAFIQQQQQGGCVTSAGHAPSCDRGCPMRRLVYRRADIWSIWLPGEPDWRDEAPVCGWTVTSKHVSEGHVWEATLTRPKIASVGGRRTRSIRQEPEMSAGRFAFQ